MTKPQAYRQRARAQFRELQRTEAYRLGQYRRRQRDWGGYLFLAVVTAVVLVAVLGVVIFTIAVTRLVLMGLGWE